MSNLASVKDRIEPLLETVLSPIKRQAFAVAMNLPENVQRRLVGKPVTYAGQTLAVDTQIMLALMKLSGEPGRPSTKSPEEARRAARAGGRRRTTPRRGRAARRASPAGRTPSDRARPRRAPRRAGATGSSDRLPSAAELPRNRGAPARHRPADLQRDLQPSEDRVGDQERARISRSSRRVRFVRRLSVALRRRPPI